MLSGPEPTSTGRRYKVDGRREDNLAPDRVQLDGKCSKVIEENLTEVKLFKQCQPSCTMCSTSVVSAAAADSPVASLSSAPSVGLREVRAPRGLPQWASCWLRSQRGPLVYQAARGAETDPGIGRARLPGAEWPR